MRYSFFIILLVFTSTIFGQVTNSGTPKSWNIPLETSSFQTIQLPFTDIAVVKKEEEKKSMQKNRPLRIGVAKKVDYNLKNSGVWTVLPNGDRIWRIAFESKDAVHLSVNFSKFHIPENASLYLYNDDKTDLLGAYTHINNNDSGLGTWFVMGDKLWLEYYEPASVKNRGTLEISQVVHGFRLGSQYQKGYNEKTALNFNTSGNCNHDVDCDTGDDFLPHKELLKNAVGLLKMGQYLCTGTLINNTAQDKTPYFLSAEHCLERDDDEDPINPSLFSMRFKWISPDPVCAQTTNSTNTTDNFSLNGATIIAKHVAGDALLIKANNAINPDWDVNFAGWDRSDTNPSYGVSIHHPGGDIMKVSRDDDGPVKSTGYKVAGWLIGGTSDGTGNGWEIGVTEGGSSGAGLFDQNGHLIGQLSGGNAGCTGLTDNDEYDLFGRFAVAWNGTSSATRLRDWLDPTGSGVATLNTLSNTLSVSEYFDDGSVKVFPNPTRDIVNIVVNNATSDLQYQIYNQLGQVIVRKTALGNGKIHVDNLPNAVYFLKISNAAIGNHVVKKVIVNR